MNLAFHSDEIPTRICFEQPLSDDALMRFSAANEWLRVERDANGELIVMSPAGTDGGSTELEVGAEIYRPGNSPEVLYDPSSVHGTGPVTGFELVMARVWQ